MRWQKVARLAIAAFVVVFAAIVFIAMRQRAGVSGPADEPRRIDPVAVVESGPGQSELTKEGKLIYSLKWKNQLIYKDGRSKSVGITLTLPDRNGRTFTVTADEGTVVAPTDNSESRLKTGVLKGNVRLTTDNGVVVTSAEATYDDAEGMVRVPGAVEFTRGRMKGTGVGATYDKNKDVLWILDQAHIIVTPDTSGGGAVEGSSGTAGLARADNYLKMVKDARLVSDGRTAQASEITILLDESGEKMQQMQLRERSSIVGSGSGAQSMAANNIDVTYAPDGRTVQHSKLMENSVVELPGAEGGPNSRVSGSTIDIGMSPDGATVTGLDAQQKVQVDLPAQGETPAKRITSTTMHSVGAPGAGLQNAVFEGPVEYAETRAANGKSPAVERHATSLRLIVDTKPGFGALQRADFHGNACFIDGPVPPATRANGRGATCIVEGQTSAEAPRAVYTIDTDMLDLSPSAGDPGAGPRLTNKNLDVLALNIHLSPSTQKLKADTNVRSTIKPQQKGATTENKVPVMLKQDRPVTVTSNRLEYDGQAEATYTGDALLWQDQSRIQADVIVLNNQTGNLTARTKVRSTMIFQDEDPKTKVKKASETRVTADALDYNDAKRLATYTATGTPQAHLISAQGDILGDRIDLYFKESGNELDRAESDGKTVSVKLERMYATGKHLVYTAANDKYVLDGQPAISVQKDEQGKCSESRGTRLTYLRTTDSLRVEAIPGLASTESKAIDPCPAELKH
jgi:lipopolysaccharide export system protein LptA